ncbi:hypothetical protein [Chitinophaga solisilvae]|uniref:hypothetical protein n=1 Tax=Chitinophaga solisilvae TaxID=1233460 RepID=UPI00136E077D|nr:hypothetical protein [Chitinophaga solisilvae]
MELGASRKATISKILMEQAYDSLTNAITAREKNQFSVEVRLSVNVMLLLGISLEGVVNELGENTLDNWTWNELEKSTTPLKWKVILGAKKNYPVHERPIQTIIEVMKLRNYIAHPKLKNNGGGIILVGDQGEVLINPTDDTLLPGGDLTIYDGYNTLIKDFNARNALMYTTRSLQAINEIVTLYQAPDFEWSMEMLKEVEKMKVERNTTGN